MPGRVEVTVDIPGLKTFADNLDDLPARKRVLDTVLRKCAAIIHRAAGHGIKRRTGHTAGQLTHEQRGELVWAVVVYSPVALFLQFGTRAHLIAARNARALMLPVHPGAGQGGPTFGVTFGPRGTARLTGVNRRGQVSFFRSVNHPGQRPYPFMSTAVIESLNLCQNVLLVEGQKVVQQMAAAGQLKL